MTSSLQPRSYCKKPNVRDVNVAKSQKYMGCVRPLAVRCISGHSNSAVDMELTTIPITEKMMKAVGGAWHIWLG